MLLIGTEIAKLLQDNTERCVKLKMNAPFDLVILHFITYPIKITVSVHKDVCPRIFTITLYEMIKH